MLLLEVNILENFLLQGPSQRLLLSIVGVSFQNFFFIYLDVFLCLLVVIGILMLIFKRWPGPIVSAKLIR